jgi:hypothetical protein
MYCAVGQRTSPSQSPQSISAIETNNNCSTYITGNELAAAQEAEQFDERRTISGLGHARGAAQEGGQERSAGRRERLRVVAAAPQGAPNRDGSVDKREHGHRCPVDMVQG